MSKLSPAIAQSFARSSVEYLGHVVSCDGIRPDPRWRLPEDVSLLPLSNVTNSVKWHRARIVPSEDELPDEPIVDNKLVREPNSEQAVAASYDSEQYNIERIIKEGKRKGKKQFLVKWERYGPENDSWVDQADIINLPNVDQNIDEQNSV